MIHPFSFAIEDGSPRNFSFHAISDRPSLREARIILVMLFLCQTCTAFQPRDQRNTIPALPWIGEKSRRRRPTPCACFLAHAVSRNLTERCKASVVCSFATCSHGNTTPSCRLPSGLGCQPHQEQLRHRAPHCCLPHHLSMTLPAFARLVMAMAAALPTMPFPSMRVALAIATRLPVARRHYPLVLDSLHRNQPLGEGAGAPLEYPSMPLTSPANARPMTPSYGPSAYQSSSSGLADSL